MSIRPTVTSLVLVLLVLGCSNYVTVEKPPLVDLKQFKTIGIAVFTGDSSPSLRRKALQRMIATMQQAQPGVRVLEIGEVSSRDLSPAEVKAVGQQHGVDGLLTAELNVNEGSPSMSFSTSGMSGRVDAKGELTATLRDTTQGATVWTNGAHGTWNLGGMSADAGGASVGVRDADARYDKMITDLVYATTHNFRPTTERKQVD